MKSSTPISNSRLYAIGGSPCSGKSSVAEALVARHDLAYYRCDEAYFRHVAIANQEQYPRLFRASRASPEEVWIRRGVRQQIEDELELYREEFPLILHDLASMPANRPIVAEGAALLPQSLAVAQTSCDRAIWIVPTEEFQRYHYEQRPWRHDVVKECSDPKQAWENWMARDAGFAKAVAEEAQSLGFKVLTTDGTRSIDDTVRLVEEHFGLISDRL
jgi:hypothetical protein